VPVPLELDPRALERLVVAALGRPPTAITPMPGGASTRRYLRVATGGPSAVAMFVPDAAPEEATSPSPTPTRWPFLEVQALLDARGVRVPRLLGEACADGLILLEDLADETLSSFLQRSPDRRAEVYRLAVRDLARAQTALHELPEGSIVRTRAFDQSLLRWELDHFREWGLEARGKALSPVARATFDEIADRLARRIAAWPRGFVHRDYQSTNLMLATQNPLELCWLDFQDALLGPRVYDLVALLNDSYQDLDRTFIDARLDDYAAACGLSTEERETLGREFDVMTVQRKLKDAGRFVFIDRVKHNPGFLKFVDPTLAKVRTSMTRLEDDDDIRDLARILHDI